MPMPYYVGLTGEVAPGTVMRPDIAGGDGPDAEELWVWATTELDRAIKYAVTRRRHRDGDGPIFVYEVALDSATLEMDQNDHWPGGVQARSGHFVRLAASFTSIEEALTSAADGRSSEAPD